MNRLIAVFALLIIFAVPAQAKDSVLDIQEVRSKSGITAWLVEDSSIPVIAIEFAFKGAGSAQDGAEKQGFVRMLSNTLDEGAGDLDAQAFQKELQDLSMSLEFSSSRDALSGSFKTLSKNKARAFELLNLALTAPRFDEEAVVRMKKANQSRVRSSLSDPDWIAARIMNDVAFAGHPYALNSGGTLSTLEAISAEDLRAFHTAHLGHNNVVIGVAGDITAEELAQVLEQVFGDLPKVDIAPIADLDLQNQGSLTLYEKQIPQTILQILQPGINIQHPDYHIAQVMSFVLGSSGFGSRLTEEIREKRGLTYGIYSTFFGLDHIDTIRIGTSTKNENVGEMMDLIRAEFQKLIDAPIHEEELADAKSYLIGSFPLSLTSTNRIAGMLASLQQDGLPIDYLDQRAAAIEATSIQDVQRVARALLSPDHFVTIMVGQPVGEFDATIRKDLPNAE